MRLRPCIDIHNGQVKQIVGGSLKDESVLENFISDMSARDFAKMYMDMGLTGGHVILLNPAGTEYYEADVMEAVSATEEYPGGLMVGGGINEKNAAGFIGEGASHVIVTSYIFDGMKINMDRLSGLCKSAGGAEHVVIDLSCKKGNDGFYHVMMNRWQTYTDEIISWELFDRLNNYCDEFLIHGVSVEGMQNGIDIKLVEMLHKYCNKKVTYAGGISSMDDIKMIEEIGEGRIDFTVGSALDIFGGNLSFEEIAGKYGGK